MQRETILKLLVKKEAKYLFFIIEESIKASSSKTEKILLSTETSKLLIKEEIALFKTSGIFSYWI